MAISRKELREKGYKSILTPRGSYIFKLIFKKQISQEDIQDALKNEDIRNREKLEEEQYKKKQNRILAKQVLANLTSNYLNAWEDLGYLEKDKRKRLTPKDKYHPYPENVYFSTFKPLFDYMEEEKCISLTEEEKQFLQNKEPFAHHLQYNRKQILDEYPNENLLDAIIKFYVRHYCIPYVEVLDEDNEEILTMTKKHLEVELKFSEKLKKGLLKKREKPSILRSYMKKLNARNLSIDERREWNRTFENLFTYIINFKENPKLVTSINRKFKRALGILA
jgi:hypothetical protein